MSCSLNGGVIIRYGMQHPLCDSHKDNKLFGIFKSGWFSSVSLTGGKSDSKMKVEVIWMVLL
jgi:hypothetical protein